MMELLPFKFDFIIIVHLFVQLFAPLAGQYQSMMCTGDCNMQSNNTTAKTTKDDGTSERAMDLHTACSSSLLIDLLLQNRTLSFEEYRGAWLIWMGVKKQAVELCIPTYK